MIDLLLFLGLAAGSAASAGQDTTEPQTLYARDSARAARMEVDDPATIICVRKQMTNSRTRYQKTCLTKDQWIAVLLEKDAQAQDMKMSAKGAVIR